MKYRLDTTAEVVSQILSISAELEGAQDGLGSQFEREVEEILQAICENPNLYQREYGPIRRAYVKRFRKMLYYIVRADAVRVIEVRDARQEPPDWVQRGFHEN